MITQTYRLEYQNQDDPKQEWRHAYWEGVFVTFEVAKAEAERLAFRTREFTSNVRVVKVTFEPVLYISPGRVVPK